MLPLSYSRFLFQNSSLLQACGSNSLNCKQFISFTEIRMYSSWLRNFNRSSAHVHFNNQSCREKILNLSYANILFSFKTALKRMPVILKGHSMNIVKHCAEQCEFIIAYRIRRSQQIITLYTKIWDEVALKQFFIKLRRKLTKKGKYMLLSSAAVFNWSAERITNEEISRYQNEMQVIKELKDKRYCRQSKDGEKCTCFNCLTPSEKVNSSGENESETTVSNFCDTANNSISRNGSVKVSKSEPEWDIFVNEENLTVWKKEETNHVGEGLFCYKLYGRYDDVTALDFLEAQVDLEYRLSWDSHAVKLHTIDTERNTRSDVIYWETKWPTPFSNRDYVFKRRYHVDKKNKLATLVNKSTEHPSCPVYPNKQRVKEYWSYMIIKPTEDLDKPGLEFSLTYFDNPGMAMPSTLSSYVTVTGMPVFLRNLHDAAKSLKDKRKGPSILFDDEESDDGKSSGKDRRRKPPSSSPDDKPKEPKKCPKLPDMTNFERICDSYFFF